MRAPKLAAISRVKGACELTSTLIVRDAPDKMLAGPVVVEPEPKLQPVIVANNDLCIRLLKLKSSSENGVIAADSLRGNVDHSEFRG